MILQAGAFGEHRFTTVSHKGVTTPVDRPCSVFSCSPVRAANSMSA